MRLHCFALLVLVAGTNAFVVTPSRQVARRNTAFSSFPTAIFSTPNEDDSPSKESTSFDDAGRSIVDEDDQKRMEAMGDFDSNPDYQTNDIDRMRAAIRERAGELGVEKSEASRIYIEEAAARARANVGNQQPSSSLDLSQISSGGEKKSGKDKWDEELPTMMYDPADELTEEERKEVDVVGQMSLWEQAQEEIGAAKWPDFGSAVRTLFTMFGVIVLSATLIIGWDRTLRNIYTNAGFIPLKEDIPGNLQEGLELPEGFTNNMSEEDISKFTEEINKAGK